MTTEYVVEIKSSEKKRQGQPFMTTNTRQLSRTAVNGKNGPTKKPPSLAGILTTLLVTKSSSTPPAIL